VPLGPITQTASGKPEQRAVIGLWIFDIPIEPTNQLNLPFHSKALYLHTELVPTNSNRKVAVERLNHRSRVLPAAACEYAR
jgi:hypothetical protein